MKSCFFCLEKPVTIVVQNLSFKVKDQELKKTFGHNVRVPDSNAGFRGYVYKISFDTGNTL